MFTEHCVRCTCHSQQQAASAYCDACQNIRHVPSMVHSGSSLFTHIRSPAGFIYPITYILRISLSSSCVANTMIVTYLSLYTPTQGTFSLTYSLQDASTGHNSSWIETPRPWKLQDFPTACGPGSSAGPSTVLPAPIDDGSCPLSGTVPIENPFLRVSSLDPDSAYTIPGAAPRTASSHGRKLSSQFKQACRSAESPFIDYDEPYTANDYRPRRFAEDSLRPRFFDNMESGSRRRIYFRPDPLNLVSTKASLSPTNNELFRGDHRLPKIIDNAERDPDDGVFLKPRLLNLGDFPPRLRPSPSFVNEPKTRLFAQNEAAVLDHQKFVNDMRNDEVRMHRKRAEAHSPDMEAMGMSHSAILDTTNGSPPSPWRWPYLPELLPYKSRETTPETNPEEHGSNDQPQGVTQAGLTLIDRIDPGLDVVNANHSYTPLVPIANNSLLEDITTNLLSHENDHAIPE